MEGEHSCPSNFVFQLFVRRHGLCIQVYGLYQQRRVRRTQLDSRARHTSCVRWSAFSCDYHDIWSSPQRWTSPRSARARRRREPGSRRCTRPADSPAGPCGTDEWRTSVVHGRSRDRSSADRGSRSRMTDRRGCSAYRPRRRRCHPRANTRDDGWWVCWVAGRCCKCARRRPRMAVGGRGLWKTLGNVTMLLLATRNLALRLGGRLWAR